MLDSPISMIGRRYQVIDHLGSGGMGSVYRAVDRLTGQWVALKRVLTHAEKEIANSDVEGVDLRLSLANEFRLMASLRHPHVIGVLDYGFDEAHMPYYTMDLLEDGQTIIEAAQDVSFEERIRLIVQVLQALAYTHRRGIIHRDLKPKNVLVTGGEVKVLDFGLSILRGQSDSSMESTVGTLAYMAPEVLMGAPATELSDLYAVGVMAYEMFTNRHPFEGDNVVALLKSVLYSLPDFINVDMDYSLIAVLERVLSKTPEDRFGSADEIIQALSDNLGLVLPVETAATRESFLQAARLVGRERELGLLSDALAQAMHGKGSAWLIGGESGVGKSRLLDEVATMASVQGALVMRGQAVDQGGTPYQLWRPSLRWLALLSDLSDSDLAIVEQLIPGVAQVVGRDVTTAGDAKPTSARSKLLQILQMMLRGQQQPVVIMLEDLQWAGSESLSLLTELTKSVSGLPLLLIGSYRDDEQPNLPAALPAMTLMPLTRLGEGDIAELCEAMLGPRGRDTKVVDLLQRETEGNVFFLIETVRALADEAGGLDQIGVVTLPRHVVAGGMQKIVQRRLDCVVPSNRALLRVAAVIGREFDLRLLQAVAPEMNLESWLNNCANASVIVMLDGTWRFAHDKLRNGMLVSMTDEERQTIHRQVASAIEHLYPDSPDHYAALSHHWAEAGDGEREAYYAMMAAEQDLRMGAYHEALALLNRALTITRERMTGNRTQDANLQSTAIWIKQKTAEAYAALGRYLEAETTYKEALNLAASSSDQSLTADILMSLGDVAYALEAFEQADRYYQQSHDLFESLNDVAGVVRALNSLGNVAYDLDDYDKANKLYQRSLALSRELGSQWGMAGSFAASDSTDDSNFD